MKLTSYTIRARVPATLKLILAADLHGRSYQNSLALIRAVQPDLILCPGDMTENVGAYSLQESCNRIGFEFLRNAAQIAPLYYSLGNHERGASEENRARLREAGVSLLDDSFVTLQNGVRIGGLSSRKAEKTPDFQFLDTFAALDGFKILLCHHPEYYPERIRNTAVDLTVSGHAHGGQWRFFRKGVWAPGQGLFPKYVSGVYENRLCVSRGMANTVAVPRFFNPRELVFLTLEPISATREAER